MPLCHAHDTSLRHFRWWYFPTASADICDYACSRHADIFMLIRHCRHASPRFSRRCFFMPIWYADAIMIYYWYVSEPRYDIFAAMLLLIALMIFRYIFSFWYGYGAWLMPFRCAERRHDFWLPLHFILPHMAASFMLFHIAPLRRFAALHFSSSRRGFFIFACSLAALITSLICQRAAIIIRDIRRRFRLMAMFDMRCFSFFAMALISPCFTLDYILSRFISLITTFSTLFAAMPLDIISPCLPYFRQRFLLHIILRYDATCFRCYFDDDAISRHWLRSFILFHMSCLMLRDTMKGAEGLRRFAIASRRYFFMTFTRAVTLWATYHIFHITLPFRHYFMPIFWYWFIFFYYWRFDAAICHCALWRLRDEIFFCLRCLLTPRHCLWWRLCLWAMLRHAPYCCHYGYFRLCAYEQRVFERYALFLSDAAAALLAARYASDAVRVSYYVTACAHLFTIISFEHYWWWHAFIISLSRCSLILLLAASLPTPCIIFISCLSRHASSLRRFFTVITPARHFAIISRHYYAAFILLFLRLFSLLPVSRYISSITRCFAWLHCRHHYYYTTYLLLMQMPVSMPLCICDDVIDSDTLFHDISRHVFRCHLRCLITSWYFAITPIVIFAFLYFIILMVIIDAISSFTIAIIIFMPYFIIYFIIIIIAIYSDDIASLLLLFYYYMLFSPFFISLFIINFVWWYVTLCFIRWYYFMSFLTLCWHILLFWAHDFDFDVKEPYFIFLHFIAFTLQLHAYFCRHEYFRHAMILRDITLRLMPDASFAFDIAVELLLMLCFSCAFDGGLRRDFFCAMEIDEPLMMLSYARLFSDEAFHAASDYDAIFRSFASSFPLLIEPFSFCVSLFFAHAAPPFAAIISRRHGAAIAFARATDAMLISYAGIISCIRLRQALRRRYFQAALPA